MPSQRRMLAIFAVGRTVRSIGTMTVGPVTTITAPNRVATCHDESVSQSVASVATTQLTSVPHVTRRNTTRSTPRISENRRVRLPSNRMTATDNEIIGNSRSPNKASGCSQPVNGPATTPAMRRKTIAGSFRRQPSHWQKIASTPIPASSNIMSISCPTAERPFRYRQR